MNMSKHLNGAYYKERESSILLALSYIFISYSLGN